ncbi:PASTA domain-containing protein [Nonomuraea sp. M3C6]|uniref:PASTA domain-containing protein n=1 Tax=Nonomuraea marmarensis TaxID=3351344 RepID=A0ABW7ANM7_9ACTN
MRYGRAVRALAVSAIVLAAAPAMAGAAVSRGTPAACPTLAEWRSETHDGTRPGPVPDVMGMTRDNAVAALAQGGFDTEATPSDAAGDWTVSDQTPTGVELANCGSTVTIELAAASVEVPDVVDDPLEQAEQEIRDAGLVPSVAEGAAAEPRVVASQDPAAATRVPSGSTVTLRLSAPDPVSPSPEGVEVPDLRGLTESAASSRLDGLGLTLVVGDGDSGRVSGQEPAAGSVVERGSSVTVTLTPVTEPTDPASPEITPSDTTPSDLTSAPDAGITPVETGSSSTPLPILLLVVALAAAVVLVWALRRARRGPRPSAPVSVVCVPYADLSPQIDIRDTRGASPPRAPQEQGRGDPPRGGASSPSLRFEFVCHHDQGHQEIRETVR